MNSLTWRKRLAVWSSRFYLYRRPVPLPRTTLFWIALALVICFVLIFSAYFIFVLTGRHDVYQTAAEDMGIMDQAMWSVTHGQLFHQTICNTVSDTNCGGPGGITRFAIHFEPILFPLAFFYLILPDPKTLLVIQTLVVASGAFPAFLLARLRLRNELAAVAIALLYLLYPAQQQATIFEFHAVTFTAAFLLFTLYFMYTRRTFWMFVFAVLSMACKEEISLVIACFGLWSILFQHRWRSGGALVLLALGWVGLVLLIFHFFSPTGHPLLASRYSYLGSNPLQIARTILAHPGNFVRQHLFDRTRIQYLRILLAPAAYLPLLAPWILVLAVPSLALNLLSSDPNMHTGIFQYNAEIVPVLIFSTIEAMVLIAWLVRWSSARLHIWRPQALAQAPAIPPRSRRVDHWVHPAFLTILVLGILFSVVRQDRTYGVLPFSQGFQWPAITTHQQVAQRLLTMIPPTASVSAQSNLVPHVSERSAVYLFPYRDDSADYVFLDVTANPYPLNSDPYTTEVKNLVLHGNYGVLAAQDGYLLLKRNLPSPGISAYSPVQDGNDVVPDLPDEFCSFVRVPPQQVTNPLHVDFAMTAGSISLVGYSVAAPDTFPANMNTRFMQVTTYWKVNEPVLPPLRVQVLLTDQDGKQEYSSTDFPGISWCPTSTWKTGTIFRIESSTLYIGNVPLGPASVAIALLPLKVPFSTSTTASDRLPLHVQRVPASVMPAQGTNALQLGTFVVTP